ncbi:MAG: hypothetical protein ABSB41_11010 [Anaerolineales bacterium]|jgi:hypothetical protein
MNKIRIVTTTCLLVVLLTACAPSTSFVQTAIANTQTAIALLTPPVTPTPAFTATTANTPTITSTNTPQGGIGDKFNCGGTFTATVTGMPLTYSRLAGYTANGIFLVVPLQLVNITTESVDIYQNDYFVEGTVNSQTLTFSVNPYILNGLFNMGESGNPQGTINPSLSETLLLAFDVNPNGKNWVLVVKPGISIDSQICEVDIPLTEFGNYYLLTTPLPPFP